MKKVVYVTGNEDKFRNASVFMHVQDIDLEQAVLHLDEIQAERSIEIAEKKARQAFGLLRKPLFVNDASWHIPALGGFPGPFMKYIVKWLSEEDILNLMRDKADRTIVLHDTIIYKDQDNEKLFVREVRGRLLESPKGEDNGPFITKLISFSDDGHSLASVRSSGFTEREKPLWQEFADWLNKL